MSLANAYDEKRDFIRMRVESPLTLTMDSRTFECICVDLSGTGMCIETKEQLSIGDEANAFLPSYQNQFAPLNARIRINRIMEETSTFYYGAEIIELLG
ncbi:hypothetical protein NBRC116188_20920 [Oceaniserpentilla sp. 4NH20-0058]|uniref:PilZ domain-containing protein n=1 Tax=Oceaniserpentilla sp. 4NH20-0058 TaxID=3127660 RepID=UPI003109CAF0